MAEFVLLMLIISNTNTQVYRKIYAHTTLYITKVEIVIERQNPLKCELEGK